ncbi:MAG: ABC transporter permease [Bacteroidetes bacterium]|nr:ABC transporter permease [Bacteroidota bacterium]
MPEEHWDIIIKPKKKWYDLELKELFRNRDLLFLFLRRDIVSVYKQTLLGPLWFFIQPVISSFAFTIIFSVIANMKTEGPSPFLFYLGGMIPWLFFSTCVVNNANTFFQNQHVFGKVYFPRLLMPLSLTMSNILKFSLQLLLFLIIWFYHFYQGNVAPNFYALLLPIHLLAMAMMGLGIGLLFSSISIRFRDIQFIIGFIMQLAMYASSVIIPVSSAGKYKWIILANPVSAIIENFKYGFTGIGYNTIPGLAYSYGCAIVIFMAGIFAFKSAERTFVDKI